MSPHLEFGEIVHEWVISTFEVTHVTDFHTLFVWFLIQNVTRLRRSLLELEKDHDLGYQIFQKFVFLVGMATPPHFLYPSMNAKKRINFFMTISQTADETGMTHFTVTSMFFKNKMR